MSILNDIEDERVVTTQNLPSLLKKELEKAIFPRLARYKNREIVSLDCRTLRTGDAYGWMASLSKKVEEVPDLIVVIENISEIPSDALCDDPQSLENLLGHSWKNPIVYFGDYRIDRTKLTIILTSVPEYKQVWGLNSARMDLDG